MVFSPETLLPLEFSYDYFSIQKVMLKASFFIQSTKQFQTFKYFAPQKILRGFFLFPFEIVLCCFEMSQVFDHCLLHGLRTKVMKGNLEIYLYYFLILF